MSAGIGDADCTAVAVGCRSTNRDVAIGGVRGIGSGNDEFAPTRVGSPDQEASSSWRYSCVECANRHSTARRAEIDARSHREVSNEMEISRSNIAIRRQLFAD